MHTMQSIVCQYSLQSATRLEHAVHDGGSGAVLIKLPTKIMTLCSFLILWHPAKPNSIQVSGAKVME